MYTRFFLKNTLLFLIVVTFLSSIGTFLISPTPTYSAIKPFGGKTKEIKKCKNIVKLITVGPPVGGKYIWGPMTKTYLHGPPKKGNWNLGIAGLPSICIISFDPPKFKFGPTMILLGTSN